eukprot:12914756-Alexandrium_andersonii.AAC.1
MAGLGERGAEERPGEAAAAATAYGLAVAPADTCLANGQRAGIWAGSAVALARGPAPKRRAECGFCQVEARMRSRQTGTLWVGSAVERPRQCWSVGLVSSR